MSTLAENPLSDLRRAVADFTERAPRQQIDFMPIAGSRGAWWLNGRRVMPGRRLAAFLLVHAAIDAHNRRVEPLACPGSASNCCHKIRRFREWCKERAPEFESVAKCLHVCEEHVVYEPGPTAPEIITCWRQCRVNNVDLPLSMPAQSVH